MQSYIDMGWVYGEKYDRKNRIHPDLVPYGQLGKLEQDKDSVFVALCEIARLWIYDPEMDEIQRLGQETETGSPRSTTAQLRTAPID